MFRHLSLFAVSCTQSMRKTLTDIPTRYIQIAEHRNTYKKIRPPPTWQKPDMRSMRNITAYTQRTDTNKHIIIIIIITTTTTTTTTPTQNVPKSLCWNAFRCRLCSARRRYWRMTDCSRGCRISAPAPARSTAGPSARPAAAPTPSPPAALAFPALAVAVDVLAHRSSDNVAQVAASSFCLCTQECPKITKHLRCALVDTMSVVRVYVRACFWFVCVNACLCRRCPFGSLSRSALAAMSTTAAGTDEKCPKLRNIQVSNLFIFVRRMCVHTPGIHNGYVYSHLLTRAQQLCRKGSRVFAGVFSRQKTLCMHATKCRVFVFVLFIINTFSGIFGIHTCMWVYYCVIHYYFSLALSVFLRE